MLQTTGRAQQRGGTRSRVSREKLLFNTATKTLSPRKVLLAWRQKGPHAPCVAVKRGISSWFLLWWLSRLVDASPNCLSSLTWQKTKLEKKKEGSFPTGCEAAQLSCITLGVVVRSLIHATCARTRAHIRESLHARWRRSRFTMYIPERSPRCD